MTRTSKYLLSIPALLVGAGMFVSCQNEIQEIRAATDALELPVQTTYNAEYFYTESGQLKNKLSAGQLDRYLGDEPRVEVSDGFEMVVYDSLENIEAWITAENGVMLETENTLIARNDVQVYNTGGDTLKTEELTWLQDSARIFSNTFVTVISPKGTFTGDGFTSDETFEAYTISNPVGHFAVERDSTQTQAP